MRSGLAAVHASIVGAALSLLLLHSACSTSPDVNPTTTDAGSDGAENDSAMNPDTSGPSDAGSPDSEAGSAPWFCTAETPTISDGGAGSGEAGAAVYADTTHYHLYAETNVADATEMARLLKEDRPIILSELHPTQLERASGIGADEFLAELRGFGYRAHRLDGSGQAGAVIERAPAEPLVSVVFLHAV